MLEGIPWLSAGDHDVEYDDELSHAGDEGDLCRLPFGDQALVVGLEDGIAACRRADDGEEEQVSQLLPAAPDEAPSVVLAAVVVADIMAAQGPPDSSISTQLGPTAEQGPITPIPPPPAVDPRKRALGERLFQDVRLSAKGDFASIMQPNQLWPKAEIAKPAKDDAVTTRERWAQHSSDPACSYCHESLDPVGFAMAPDPTSDRRVPISPQPSTPSARPARRHHRQTPHRPRSIDSRP